MTNYANARNYIRKDDNEHPPEKYNISFLKWSGEIERPEITVEKEFSQCTDHYNKLSTKQKEHFVTNVAASLSTAQKKTQTESLSE